MRGIVVAALLALGCQPAPPTIVPDRISEDAVAETEFVVAGLPPAELWGAQGASLERREPPQVWIGERAAEVVAVGRDGVRVRMREGLPRGSHSLRVQAHHEYVSVGALTVEARVEMDGAVPDASVAEAGPTEAGSADAGDAEPADASVFDAGARADAATPPDAAPADASSTAGDAGGDTPRGTCTGGSVGTRCECRTGDECSIDCRDDCTVVCQPGSECSVVLHDDGVLRCRALAVCELDAHDRTEVTCGPGSSCRSSFHRDATVSCAPVSSDEDCCIADCRGGCSGAPACG